MPKRCCPAFAVSKGQVVTAEPAACARCSARLEQFVGDWLLGVDVARRQPAVWQHLQVCQGCRAEFEALAELLALEVEAVLRERAGDSRGVREGEHG